MTKLQLPSVSINESTENISKAIEESQGALVVTDLPQVPFKDIREAFDHLTNAPHLTDRLNKAYTNNLVYKDSFASGNGGAKVDMKRVLDLSPERLEEITANDPSLAAFKGALGDCLTYWDGLRLEIGMKLVDAVALAVGSEDVKRDAAFNYRMVDYYERSAKMVPPRCGEHRDFGTFTLVHATRSGFEIHDGGKWKAVDVPPSNSAIMVFGWCTQIRSNGRIPAVLHRVTDVEDNNAIVVPRRLAAVLFCAPKRVATPLEPVVRDGEEQKYISGVVTGQLRGAMKRKWAKREGTLKDAEKIMEEHEILVTKMVTQDDVVQQTIRV